ncbi:MAG TPA: substrate-binding domain-containing protein, partial [Vicinamibacterales bacterium]|nr:substrate-binding domain-containing protein [Vicinamibacterales bacterium]
MAGARYVRLPLILLAAALTSAAACDFACGVVPEPVVLATTTSVGNSGLLDRVLPHYQASEMRTVLVGSGRALEMLARGTAGVVISHAPLREQAALDSHPSWYYGKILFNDFLIVGPADDPAGVAHAQGAVEAMQKIAASGAVFLSRGDESGTHERERELWALAGAAPRDGRLVVAGAGMGQTLRVASGTGAYTLTDRGTFEALRGALSLRELHSGDPRLMNTYAVIADPQHARGAAFARWLAEGEGRQRLAEATREIRGFEPWPALAAADTPAA